ncbi:GntR family transcriptional regulator [Terrimicrobium sacchariphilum]|nr:GntR family transcriptional regulator [Terrimicrobium sacchariphilum]
MSASSRVTDLLRHKALSQAPGEKLPSVRALMNRYDTSLHSINQALRQLEAEGLITTKKGSGIFINPQKGVRYIELHRPQYPSPTMDVKEISLDRAVSQAGWKLVIKRQPVNGDDPDIRPHVRTCAHVVMPTIIESNPGFFKEITSQSSPILAYGRSAGPFQLDYVTGDDHRYMSLLVKHLLSLGHRHLALLENEPPFFSILQRSEIFLNLVDLFDLPKPVIIPCHTERGESSLHRAYAGLKEYLSANKGKPGFTALISASSAGVIGALRAFHESDIRVPKDCSLASFGLEASNALIVPSVTEVGVADDHWGEGAVQVLAQRFADPEAAPIGLKLTPELFVRESTAPPPR